MDVTESILDQWQDACDFLVATFPVDLALVLKSEEGCQTVLCVAPSEERFQRGEVFRVSEEQVAFLHVQADDDDSSNQNESADPTESSICRDLTLQKKLTGFCAEFTLPVTDPDGARFGFLCLFSSSESPIGSRSATYARQLQTQMETGLALLKEKEYLQLAYETIRKSVEEINVLRKILPICAHCKKVRNDNGYWQQVENYFHQSAQMDFTHSICPDCMHELYPDIADRILEQAKGKT
jgi:hypothetical protein